MTFTQSCIAIMGILWVIGMICFWLHQYANTGLCIIMSVMIGVVALCMAATSEKGK